MRRYGCAVVLHTMIDECANTYISKLCFTRVSSHRLPDLLCWHFFPLVFSFSSRRSAAQLSCVCDSIDLVDLFSVWTVNNMCAVM